VGIELGLQPALFSENGHALYSPYTIAQAVPAMLAAHMFGASIVEAFITALGVAYLQKRHPELLMSMKSVFAGPDSVEEGVAPRRPLWQTITWIVLISVVVLIGTGLITGGGDITHAFGADWSSVDWSSVAIMLIVTGIIAAIFIPLAWFLLPKRYRAVGAGIVSLAILAPLGLIAPGFAYGEGSADDVQAAFGYIPSGLRDLSTFFSAPLSGYNVPLPFFSDANADLWKVAIGYEIAGIVGILLISLVIFGLVYVIQRMSGGTPSESPTDELHGPSTA